MLMGSLGLISRSVSSRDIGRHRYKDFREREVRNGGERGRSDCVYVRSLDSETGELSYDSGFVGAIEIERHDRKREIGKFVNINKRSNSQCEKRRFSPIVCNSDDVDDEDGPMVKARNSAAKATPRLFPSIAKSGRGSSHPDDDVSARISNAKVDVAVYSHVSTPSESPRSVSPLSSVGDANELEEVRLKNGLGAEVLDDDEYMSLPSISASRWAHDVESPTDEGEISDDEEMRKFKRKKHEICSDQGTQKSKRMRSVPDYSETMRQWSVTPEFGKPKEEGSERNKVRSSDERTRPSSSCTYQDEDEMEICLERNDIGPSFSNLESDSDDNCSLRKSLDNATVPPRTTNMLQGCRSVDEFERLNKINEGTYGVVYRAKDKKTGEIVALKKVKMEKEKEGFPLTALREINILLAFHHPSIVAVKEVVVGCDLDSIFMSMEYMDHDLRGLMETMKEPFSQSEVKCLMLQLLEGVKYLHDNWVLHRDLKTSNLLLNNRGKLKICDFGLARQYGSPLKPYTALVVTLWYRAPELLLGAKEYSTAIDMWSVGCIMAELLSKKPLFKGKTEVDQLDKIFRLLSTPNENIWPGFSNLPGVKANFVKHQYNRLRQEFPATSFTGSPVLSDAGFRLLNSLLTFDPKQRMSAEDALKHEWFREVPLPKEKEFMPTYPAQHAQDRCMWRFMKSPDPLEKQYARELLR